jgi:hypothetical protein
MIYNTTTTSSLFSLATRRLVLHHLTPLLACAYDDDAANPKDSLPLHSLLVDTPSSSVQSGLTQKSILYSLQHAMQSFFKIITMMIRNKASCSCFSKEKI